MTLTPKDAVDLCIRIRMDLTNAQGKLTDVIEALAAIPEPASADRVCPTCGVKTRGPLSLAEHVHTSHGGPLPSHWVEAERLAGIAP